MLNKSFKHFFILSLSIYRVILSPWLGGACRFEPSCSAYADEALQKYPLKTAMILIIKRLGKCHPAGPFGFDPVPERMSKEGAT